MLDFLHLPIIDGTITTDSAMERCFMTVGFSINISYHAQSCRTQFARLMQLSMQICNELTLSRLQRACA